MGGQRGSRTPWFKTVAAEMYRKHGYHTSGKVKRRVDRPVKPKVRQKLWVLEGEARSSPQEQGYVDGIRCEGSSHEARP